MEIVKQTHTITQQLKQYKTLSTSKRINGMSESYYKNLRLYMQDFLNRHKVIDFQNLLAYVASKDMKPSSKRTIAVMLGKFAVTYGYVNEGENKRLCTSFTKERLNWSGKGVSNEDVVSLIKVSRHASSPYTRARNSLMVFFMATYGMRIGQLLSIKTTDVYKESDKLVVKILPQKKRDPRENLDIKRLRLSYQIGSFLLEDMYEKYSKVKINSEYFFTSQTGEQLAPRYVQHLFVRYSEALDVKITPHTLRHYVGTKLAGEFGLERTAIWLGHENINTTSLYLNPERLSMEL